MATSDTNERKEEREGTQGENEDMNTVKSGSEDRQEMGIDDNTHRSEQQRRRRPPAPHYREEGRAR